MLRWGWLALGVACSTTRVDIPSPPPEPDASVPLDIELTMPIRDFLVVRGETVDIPFFLSGRDASKAKAVSVLGLSPGLSSAPVYVTDTTSGTITIAATADAYRVDSKVVLTTSTPAVDGTIVFNLDVVDVDGSLDPSFGKGGLLELPDVNSWVVGFAATNGKLLVAGRTYSSPLNQVVVERLLEDGTFDATFGVGGKVETTVTTAFQGTFANALAACDDGTFVVLAETDVAATDGGSASTAYHALYFDVAGTLTSDVLVPGMIASTRATCLGGVLTLVTSELLTVIDSSHAIHSQPLPKIYYDMFSAATPSALIVASSQVLKLVPDAPSHYAFDPTFGQGGSMTPPAMVMSLVLDQAGRIVSTLTAPTPQLPVMRLYADGSLDTSFGTGGVASIDFKQPAIEVADIAVAPSGDLIVVGSSSKYVGIALARLSAAGVMSETFGDFGITTTDTHKEEFPVAAVFDSASRLWVAVNRIDQTSFLARYRITSP